MKVSVIVLISAILASANAFAGMSSGNTKTNVNEQVKTMPHDNIMSRSTFVAGTVAALFVPSVASAKGLEDAADESAKYSSKAQEKVCLDRCIYDCTKNGKSKSVCRNACEEECKTAKGQLTYGTPDVDKGSETTQ